MYRICFSPLPQPPNNKTANMVAVPQVGLERLLRLVQSIVLILHYHPFLLSLAIWLWSQFSPSPLPLPSQTHLHVGPDDPNHKNDDRWDDYWDDFRDDFQDDDAEDSGHDQLTAGFPPTKPAPPSTFRVLRGLNTRLALVRRFVRAFRFLDGFLSAYRLFQSLNQSAASASPPGRRGRPRSSTRSARSRSTSIRPSFKTKAQKTTPTRWTLKAVLTLLSETTNSSYLLLESLTLLNAFSIPGLSSLVWSPEACSFLETWASKFWFVALVASAFASLMHILDVLTGKAQAEKEKEDAAAAAAAEAAEEKHHLVGQKEREFLRENEFRNANGFTTPPVPASMYDSYSSMDGGSFYGAGGEGELRQRGPLTRSMVKSTSNSPTNSFYGGVPPTPVSPTSSFYMVPGGATTPARPPTSSPAGTWLVVGPHGHGSSSATRERSTQRRRGRSLHRRGDHTAVLATAAAVQNLTPSSSSSSSSSSFSSANIAPSPWIKSSVNSDIPTASSSFSSPPSTAILGWRSWLHKKLASTTSTMHHLLPLYSRQELRRLVLRLAADILDLAIPGSATGWIPLDQPTVSVAMLGSTLLTGWEVWRRCWDRAVADRTRARGSGSGRERGRGRRVVIVAAG